MPVEWSIAGDIIELGGVGKAQINPGDAQRQAETAKTILERLRSQPGVLLADEVGMGKTYVAMAVVASVIVSTRRTHCPVVVMVPPGLRQKWQRIGSSSKHTASTIAHWIGCAISMPHAN